MLSGNLSALALCSALQVVYVAENMFSGSLNALAQLPQLTVLAAYGNNLTGGVPQWLFQSPSLLAAYISSNPLGGNLSIPVLGSGPTIEELDLTNCSLTGEIPAAMSQLTNLIFILADTLDRQHPSELELLIFTGSSTFLTHPAPSGLQPGRLSVLLLGEII